MQKVMTSVRRLVVIVRQQRNWRTQSDEMPSDLKQRLHFDYNSNIQYSVIMYGLV